MLDLIKLIRDEILADVAITTYVSSRVYMSYKPVGNTLNDYQQIVINDEDGPTDSLTNDYRPELRIHIWTKGSEKVTIANKIAKQILLNIDKKSYLTNDPRVYQLWKENGVELWEDDSQTFHKVLSSLYIDPRLDQ